MDDPGRAMRPALPERPARLEALRRIRVVLVEPKSPGNVGAVARACANAGLGGLAVAGPVGWDDGDAFHAEASRLARHATPIVDAMTAHADVASAVAEASFVVGTSVRTTGPQRLATPRSAAGEIVARALGGGVALVFGREDRGLSVDELLACDLKVTIPSSDEYPAWNLSHAVAVLAAAVREEAEAGGPGAAPLAASRPFPDADLAPATHESLERLYTHLGALLLAVGFLDPANPDRVMADLRRMLSSRGLEERDVRILLGMVHQLSWACGRAGAPPPAAP